MPYSLRTIAGIICDKNETINFMREKKLLAKNHSCCDQVCSQVKSKSSDGFEFHCKKCDHRYSISIRSFFFNVHMLLQNLLLMTYLFALKVPVKVCIDLMVGEVSHVSIKQWYNFLREGCSQHLFRHNNLLGGPGKVVQLDKTGFGHVRKYNRGYFRGSGLKWIFGIIDVQTSICHLELVEKRDRDMLFPTIQRHIARETEIHSDEAVVYFSLNQSGYLHRTVKHTEYYVNPNDGTHTNNIENFWSHLKTHFRSMHGVNNENLSTHLDEFMYRWNTKNVNAFDQLISDISEQYKV